MRAEMHFRDAYCPICQSNHVKWMYQLFLQYDSDLFADFVQFQKDSLLVQKLLMAIQS